MSETPAPALPATAKPRTLSRVDDLKLTLGKMTFKDALPAHVTEEKFRRVLLTAISQTPALAEADRTSVLAACMKAAQDGLLPDGREAALVLFKDKAQYMPMFAGILKKIRNSGELASITAQVICKSDKFEFYTDEKGEHLIHKPDMLGERGELVGVYAIAITKDGASYIEVMPKREIEKVRNVSRAKDSGPWVTWYDEMARKTVIRRLSKRLPMSTDLDQVLEHDNETYDLEPEQPAAPANPGRPSGLGRIIDAKKAEEAKPVDLDKEPAPADGPPPASDDIPL